MPTAPTGPQLLVALLRVAILLSGCASLVVADTTPLAPSQMAPLGSESISTGGFRLSALTTAEATPDLLVLVAISGGCKRSAAYSYGALEAMRDVSVQTAGGPQPLLSPCGRHIWDFWRVWRWYRPVLSNAARRPHSFG